MRRIVLWCLAASAAACGGRKATSAEAGAAPAPASTASTATSRSADVITEAEVTQATGVTNAYDLIRRLRPNFLRTTERTSLRTNSPAPLVRLDGQVLGEITELRTVEVSVIREIRYYSIVEAESRFSGVRGRPLIAITTRRNR